MEYSLKIAYFYPELLNLYGDKGNVIALKKRAEWRNIRTEICEISGDEQPDFENIDIAVIGGGSEKELLNVLEKMKKYESQFRNYVENGGVVLAVCGGFELLGKKLVLNDMEIAGLSIADIYTEKGEKRFTGNVVVETPFGKIAGFENHTGRTFINENKPLGTVVFGNGNNGKDHNEGLIYKNLVGTYLHGALLPKNPELTDEFILRALKNKYNEDIKLAPLNNSCEERAKNYIINAC